MTAQQRTATAGRAAVDGDLARDLHSFADQHEEDLHEAPMLGALRAEHRHIATVLALLSDHLNAIERGELVNTAVLYEVMDYMITFPDRYHHPREDLIYAYAAELDSGLAADKARLDEEHDRMARAGRDLLLLVEGWRSGELGGDRVVAAGRDYVRNSYAHMSFEEQHVFPHIDALLSRADWRELAADDSLKPVADPVFGRRVQRGFRNMARKLRRRLRRGVEQTAVAEWVSLESLLEAYEVMGMAVQSGRSVTREQIVTSVRESGYILLDAPFRGPFLCAINNTRLSLEWLEDMRDIYRDAATDLLRVNRERKDRLRLLKRAGRP